MIPRGLTLIEVLVSLALLTSIVVATNSWLGVVRTVNGELYEQAQRDTTLDALFRSIRDDCVTGDVLPPRVERVETGGDVLRIRTRDGATGTVTQWTYRLDRLDETIVRVSGNGEQQVIVDAVTSWQCALDDDERVLRITMSRADDGTHDRRFVLPW
jgi:prepilin-type N-terminal cleavage/methylation domain-containing protein